MTTTLGRPAPPKPDSFTPEGAPVGVEIKFVTFWQQRPMLRDPLRSAFVHTNGASGEGSVDSSWNWAHAKPGSNTCPHYQIDRTHNGVTRARKMLPSNRRAIANATVDAYQGAHGDVAWWSLAIETADLGWGAGKPGGACGFDEQQGELIAAVIAYEAIVSPALRLELLAEWFGAGVASHTDPFTYPYTTLYKGKACPGEQKKREVRDWILPRAVEIHAAWTGAPVVVEPPVVVVPPVINPPTSEEDDMAFNLRITDDGTNVTDAAVFTVSGVFATWQRDGNAELALEHAGLVSGDKLVRRAGLKGLTLVGPAPDDDNFAAYQGSTLPGRTRGSDFGARLR